MTVIDHWFKAALEITAAVEVRNEMSIGYINNWPLARDVTREDLR